MATVETIPKLVPRPGVHAALRRFPWPYQAMLAICSDLDETPDWRVYWEQMRFLNTRQMTSMGEGVGLEVGNSIYFDISPGQFAYWNTDDAGREMVRALIASGHIDCLHSYGDLATSRTHAGRALEELSRHGLSLRVWVDHATAPTNFGQDIMRGHGDEPGHPAYHADLTIDHGIRYVWRGRVTSVIGQDQPVSWGGLWDGAQPFASTLTLAKEASKYLLGRAGGQKYLTHAQNRIGVPAQLRDGREVIEFLRCNPHPAGLDRGDTGDSISEVLTRRFLDRLVERQGISILYAHLGKLRERQFNQAAVEAFRQLSQYHHRKEILVTTTRRLLDYGQFAQSATVSWSWGSNGLVIDVAGGVEGRTETGPAAESQAFTLELSESSVAELRVEGRPVSFVKTQDPTGKHLVSVPWNPRPFPDL
ncbi:MAG: hypothetical protein HZA90_03760 [Verrucomicrobia bacterium]|nr:hypothetical protein [Verrucomicrobiota bacterium]